MLFHHYDLCDLLFYSLNLTALRKAKTPLSFGHSECSRVNGDHNNLTILYNGEACDQTVQKRSRVLISGIFSVLTITRHTEMYNKQFDLGHKKIAHFCSVV